MDTFKIDGWTLWGFAAQGVFLSSFLFQWWQSEKKGKSVLPLGFWCLRIVGAVMLLAYVLVRRDVVFCISLLLQIGIYGRNIILLKNENKKN